jgi:3-isopropylmalate/(R)-2-methylmalate dehydratase small subunit
LKRLTGLAHCIDGVLDVDWDLSIVEDDRFLLYAADRNLSQEERDTHLASHCLVNVDPDFRESVHTGDFLVGNRGVGWGHGHDQAILALKAVGIAAIVCETTTMTFKRNCLNHGLPIVEIQGIFAQISSGDSLILDVEKANLENVSTGGIFGFDPYPAFILELLEAGGLYPQLSVEMKRQAAGTSERTGSYSDV